MRRFFLVLAAALFVLGSPANLLLATDYFVINNGGTTGGDGSQGNPWGTITEALQNGNFVIGDVINVAAGTYNENNGESFPLHVPRGVTLSGAGVDTTTIEGLYAPSERLTGGAPYIIYMTPATSNVLGAPPVLTIEDFHIRATGSYTNTSGCSGVGSSCATGEWSALIYANIDRPSLRVERCELEGANYGILVLDQIMAVGESQNLGDDTRTFAVTGNHFYDQDTDCVSASLNGRPYSDFNIDFVSNTFSGGENGVDLYVEYSGCCFVGGTFASYHLNVSNNQFLSQSSEGFEGYLYLNGTTSEVQAVGLVNSLSHSISFYMNNVQSAGNDGLEYRISGSEDYNLELSCFLTSNTVSGGSDDGIFFAMSHGYFNAREEAVGGGPSSGDWEAYVQLRYNTVIGAGEEGVELNFRNYSRGNSIYGDVLAHFNLIESCGGDGLQIERTGFGLSSSFGRGNQVRVGGEFRGNRIALNQENGVALNGPMPFGYPSVVGITAMDFGQLAPDFGRNTIQDNADEYEDSSAFDFVNMAVSDVDAMGNWWGTTDSGLIENHILDGSDLTARIGPGTSSTIGVVDFECPLLDPVTFEVIPEIFNIPGLEIELVAGDKSAFVERIGNRDMVLNVAGLPALNVDVDDSLEDGPMEELAAGPGGRLTATVPPGVPVGLGFLFVQNAGAQTGATAFGGAAIASKVSRCFIATASFGDEDAPEVLVLRKWRDEHLATNAFGRGIVSVYYALSPSLADSISGSDTARSLTRAALAPVVGGVRLWMEMPWIYGIAGALLLFRLLRRRNG